MSEPGKNPDTDRNLLFGILAVQNSFIDRDSLVAAMETWVLHKQKPLGQILLEQEKVTVDQLAAIDALLEQQLKMHDENSPDVQLSVTKHWTGSTGGKTPVSSPLPINDGRYHKLRHHADGGQGRVFVADDTELHREVALKENKPEFAYDPENRSRLVMEAEITGGLEHPGIVPVYGLGAYSDGRPYYAMRFIRGDNLEDAIKQFHAAEKPSRDAAERSLAFRQLLRRFVDVCNAVAYAHSRGVVHRDLKPKNVMLGKFGETLVVDWGLAKSGAKDAKLEISSIGSAAETTLRPVSGSSIEATMEGTQIGTPAFMSPEQADGRIQELGPASDIYSLGSTLYLLLTGRYPFSAPTKVEVLAKVKLGKFTSPREIRPATPPALDAICCRAMALQAKDRYANALALATEIEHWLADEPVDAYPEPWTVRLGRWGRRHKAAVTGAGVFLLCATIGLAISTGLISAEQQRTEKQRNLAVDNYKISRDQSFNIIKLIESSEPEFARVPIFHERRAELLQTASNACRKYLEQDQDNAELKQRAANIFRYAANFQRLTYEHEQAEPLYLDAISLRRQIIEESPAAEPRIQFCEVLRDFASSQRERGHFQKAAENVRQGLEVARALEKAEPGLASNSRNLALLLLNQAFLESRQNRAAGAKTSTEESLTLFRKLAAGPSQDRNAYDPLLLAAALNQRAIQERQTGDLEGALKTHAEAVKLLIALRDAKQREINEADVAHLLAECQIEQCQTWARIDKPNYLSNAEKNSRKAINEIFALAQVFPKLPSYQESAAKAFLVGGELRLQGKDYSGAREHFQRAKDMLLVVAKGHGSLPSVRGELGRAYAGLGVAARQLQEKNYTMWFDLATTELQTAIGLSPDDSRWKQSWDELEQARNAKPKP
ncbi:MAG: protein kinase domain-containing protein [Pirellulaceae bacterium]